MKMKILDKQYHLLIIASLFISVFVIVFTFVNQVVSFMNKIIVVDVIVKGASDDVKYVIEKRLDYIKGTPILSLDLPNIAQDITNIPWIKYANIYRSLNGILVVNLVEVTPYFLWLTEDDRYKLVKSDNVVVNTPKSFDIKNLITIEKGNDALKNSASLRFVIYQDLQILKQIQTLRYVDYRWDIILKNGIVIKLPEKNINKAYSKVVKFNKQYNILEKNIDYIDARAENKLFIKPSVVG